MVGAWLSGLILKIASMGCRCHDEAYKYLGYRDNVDRAKEMFQVSTCQRPMHMIHS